LDHLRKKSRVILKHAQVFSNNTREGQLQNYLDPTIRLAAEPRSETLPATELTQARSSHMLVSTLGGDRAAEAATRAPSSRTEAKYRAFCMSDKWCIY
jgi:hypothetical protein